MFSFFKKKAPPFEAAPAPPPLGPAGLAAETAPASDNAESSPTDLQPPATPAPAPASWLSRLGGWVMPGADLETPPAMAPASIDAVPIAPPLAPVSGVESAPRPDANEAERGDWLARLRGGLRKTGSSITQVFVGARIGDQLYEELEAALLQADAGVKATEFLLADLKGRVKRAGTNDVSAVRALLADAVTDLLVPLERPLRVGEHVPTVMMVVGVNGAGKTTTIGKLTRHLVDARRKVLLAAADTFRAAAREQLAIWAERADLPGSTAGGRVDIVSQEGGDPAGVTFDAVIAGKARGCDVVIADTAGRLTTQAHLMEELKKIRRVIGKAQEGAPHEVLLVIDGNTGQNALSQVQAFDAALQLTGLVITKLDGTAKGGVLAAIALWSESRASPIAVYFIGVGEKLEDLQTFNAREFAQALLG